MTITLVQASVPPFDYLTWGGGVMFVLLTTTGSHSIVVAAGSYKNANQLAAAINVGTQPFNTTTSHSGPQLTFDKFTPFGPTPISITVSDEGVAFLTGLDLGTTLFTVLPWVVAEDVQIIPPHAVYLHTDMPTAQRNVDNINETKARQGDIFAKIGIPDTTQVTQFYENNSASYHYHVKTDTLSSIGLYFRDINNFPITPLEDWGLVLHVEFHKKEEGHDIVQSSLLKQAVDYLRLMWLSNPPTTTRKSLTPG